MTYLGETKDSTWGSRTINPWYVLAFIKPHTGRHVQGTWVVVAKGNWWSCVSHMHSPGLGRKGWMYWPHTRIGVIGVEWSTNNFTAGLHHGPWKMVFFPGSDFMVQLPWSSCLKNSIYKAFGPLGMCRLNVDQEEWPCTKKWMCKCEDTYTKTQISIQFIWFVKLILQGCERGYQIMK